MWGIVSNCWREQLIGGAALSDLVAHAEANGYRAIELRQGCLGTCEDAAQVPDAEQLGRLAASFSHIQFNIAMALPCLHEPLTERDPMVAAGIRAAQSLGKDRAPHLRLVDPTPGPLSTRPPQLADLASAVAAAGVQLSIENANQPWVDFLGLFRSARREMPANSGHLRVCYDPCNLIHEPQATFGQITAELKPDELAMVHAKQRIGAEPLKTVAPGDVDWAAQIQALRSLDYAGPVLFEIHPDAQVWEHLEQSRTFLRQLGLER